VIGAGLAQPHHDGSELYVDRLGDSAELRLRAPRGAAKAVLLRYVRDGEPRTVAATPQEVGGEVWWRAELPLRNEVVAYRWLLTGGSLGYQWLNAIGVHPHEVTPHADFRLNAGTGGPAWHLSAVVYEIFLDRFASSGASRPLPSWAIPRAWNRPPDPTTRYPHRELYGGDLAGVEEHLDHIESVGANVLYLTPFFPGESNHRYDPETYDRVDPLLGGEEALASLLRAAHARGFKVVGDLSLDHSGVTHDWFKAAQADESSVERSFYLFDRSETHGFESWLGYKEMPRFDWRSPELRTRLELAVRRWLEFGLDGWRLGAAGSIGRYAGIDLNAEVAHLTRAQAGDALLVGEYWNDFQPDLDGRGWHGVMNYGGFLRPTWWWLRDESLGPEVLDVFSSAPAPTYGAAEAADVMQAARAGAPWDASLHSWLLLDSHDTPRFANVSGSRERYVVGLGLQMTTPGVPVVFAGDELGLEGAWGYDGRRTMPWDRRDTWDETLLDAYRRMIALRRSSDALARGGIRYVHATDDALVYLRETRVERLLCLAARAPHEPLRVAFAELETLYGEDAHDGVLPSGGPAFHVWRIPPQ
jgi:alpha-glucosidase